MKRERGIERKLTLIPSLTLRVTKHHNLSVKDDNSFFVNPKWQRCRTNAHNSGGEEERLNYNLPRRLRCHLWASTLQKTIMLAERHNTRSCQPRAVVWNKF